MKLYCRTSRHSHAKQIGWTTDGKKIDRQLRLNDALWRPYFGANEKKTNKQTNSRYWVAFVKLKISNKFRIISENPNEKKKNEFAQFRIGFSFSFTCDGWYAITLLEKSPGDPLSIKFISSPRNASHVGQASLGVICELYPLKLFVVFVRYNLSHWFSAKQWILFVCPHSILLCIFSAPPCCLPLLLLMTILRSRLFSLSLPISLFPCESSSLLLLLLQSFDSVVFVGTVRPE